MKLGAHMSTAGGAWKALQRGRSIGCDAVQIFVKNNMRWFGRPPSPEELALYANELAREKAPVVFGHSGYLINVGAPPSANRDKSIKSLIQEIQFASALGLPFLVLHPGAHLGAGEKAGLARAVAGLDEVIRANRHSPVCIALENTAGQGTCLGHRFAHLADILQVSEFPHRLGVCIDTAHLFAAGYDLRIAKRWEAVVAELSSMIGLNRVLAFHLNDSKTDLGSRVDRHAHIGEGKIGLRGFRLIVNDPRLADLPACLETPKSDDMHEDVRNLQTLRSLQSRVHRRQRNA